MDNVQLITVLLVIGGGIIICFPVYYTFKLLRFIKTSKYISYWKFLLILMVFFCLSYFVVAGIIISGDVSFVYALTGLIFFYVAFFVYLTVWTGKNTIEDLLNTTVSKNYVENIIKSMADTLIVINADNNATIKTINNAAVNLLGYERPELVGSSIDSILDSSTLDSVKKETISDSKQLSKVETTYRTKSGEEIPVSISATVLKNTHGEIEGAIYVARDIRQQKEAEQKIKEYVEQLKQLNANKDRFFSIIAHDLRNPFTAVLGFSDILAKDAGKMDGETIKEFSSNLYSQSKAIYDLLENLLDWARIQTGSVKFNPVNIDLHRFVNEATGIYNNLVNQKKVELNINCDPEIKVFADENMLSTVFRNLTSNAIKFTNEGGSILIDAKEIDDKFVEVSVRDNGVGISLGDQEKLFKIDEHLSTKGTNNEEGTGLGLILCKDLVNKNGGKINMESEAGKGTTFKFTIPKPS